MQGGTVRVAVAGFLAVVILSALGPSMAAAVEAAEDQPPPASRVKPIEPAWQPDPLKALPQPTPRPTPKPKPTATPKAKTKPKPTPARQSPGHGPGGQAPGDPKPVRPAEPAPGLPEFGADAPPGTPAEPPSGGAGSGLTQPRVGAGPSPSRVHLVVAGATASGIAAVAGWLVLGGRRRERSPERPSAGIPRPPATTVTLADGMQLDLEVVVNRPDGTPPPRYAGRVPGTASTTLWQNEDDRPRWLKRIDEQGPARPRPSRSAIGLDDHLED